MSRRGEPVPFAFVAEADRFRSDVAPPPPEQASLPQILGRTLLGLVLVAGLAGSLLLGMPALEVDHGDPEQEASESR